MNRVRSAQIMDSPKTGANCRETRRAGTILCRLGVLCRPGKIDQHAALIANDPGVVTGRHIECITRAIFDFGTVIHLHEHAPFKDIAGMRRLARRRSNDGLDMLRPTPSGFKDAPANCMITDCNDLKLALAILERARFVRLV